ncbi:hypothetical protein NVP1052A_43 [Vibrio phage 1.052.A._10N.286.46.C3]|nr:hypothetical protein NVP1052A_43 [Vibrio phage 1.052.A._10N.286.46.C3]
MTFKDWYSKYYDILRDEWLENGAGISLKAWAKTKYEDREE